MTASMLYRDMTWTPVAQIAVSGDGAKTWTGIKIVTDTPTRSIVTSGQGLDVILFKQNARGQIHNERLALLQMKASLAVTLEFTGTDLRVVAGDKERHVDLAGTGARSLRIGCSSGNFEINGVQIN